MWQKHYNSHIMDEEIKVETHVVTHPQQDLNLEGKSGEKERTHEKPSVPPEVVEQRDRVLRC